MTHMNLPNPYISTSENKIRNFALNSPTKLSTEFSNMHTKIKRVNWAALDYALVDILMSEQLV